MIYDDTPTAEQNLPKKDWRKGLMNRVALGDKTIWIIAILLFTFSLAVVFSATSQEAFKLEYKGGNFYGVILKHFVLILFAAFIMVVVANVPTKVFIKWSNILLGVSILLLVLVQFAGVEINGSRRWFMILGFTFQPSEIARIALINFVAVRLMNKNNYHNSIQNFWIIMVVTGIVCFLIFLENISTAALLFLTIYMLSWIGGVNRKMMWRMTYGLSAASVLILILVFAMPKSSSSGIGRTDTGSSRLTTFFSKIGKPINTETYNDVTGRDYQVVSAQKAIANSNFWGVGPGNSELRQFLPQAFSDYVYNVIVEEYGIPGAAILLILYVVLFFRLGKLARRTDSMYKSLVLMGVGLIITLQAIINMAVAANLLPVTGQTLPFISRGGTSYVITAGYFGIVLSISNEIQKYRQLKDAQIAGMNMPEVEVEAIPEIEPEEEEV